jgi:phage shock protein PspC (stress-responsive transcriptional regulator)
MLSGWTYGADAVLANTWVASVVLGLVGSGVVLYVLGRQTTS